MFSSEELYQRVLALQKQACSADPALQSSLAELAEDLAATPSCALLIEEHHRMSQMLKCFPTPVFDEDFSPAGVILDRLRAEGVEDVTAYLTDHPLLVRQITEAVTIRNVNDAALALYGMPRGHEFYATLDHLIVEASYPDFILQVVNIWQGKDLFEQEMKNYNSRGRIIHLILTLAVIDRERYGLSRVLVTITDISELKRAHEQQALLEQRLAESERLEALGRLAGGAAHNLNNLLVGIMSYPDLLLMDMGEADPLKQPLELIRDAGTQAGAIVQDLLTLSRGSAAVSEVIELNELIRVAADSAEVVAAAAAHSLVTCRQELEGDLLPLIASPVHITKMIKNLLLNAYQACSGREAVVTIGTRNLIDRADEQAPSEAYVELTVRDEGSYLSCEHPEEIFEPFFTRKMLGRRGTGLEMSIVHGVVLDHHGSISVTTGNKTGTLFTIRFPAVPETMRGMGSHITGPSVRGAGEQILIIDDMAIQRKVLSHVLTKFGYSVRSVSSGMKAIALIESGYRPELVVLDMMMPGLDGLDTYRALREVIPELKAIIVSGYAGSSRVQQALSLGVNTFMQKPYTVEQLGKTVSSLMGEASKRTQKREDTL